MAAGGNPSSVHRVGRLARATVDRAREQVAAMVGATGPQVIFTSGGTEANAQALSAARGQKIGPVVVSSVEHPSVREGAAALTPSVIHAPVDGDGVLDLVAFEEILATNDCAAVSLMLANNETGVIQPVAEAAKLAHTRGLKIHCDGAQAPGKIPVDFQSLGVDYLTLAAHKISGPQGVGAVIVRDGEALPPMLRGGGQESGQRAGTENVPGIAGFGVAADLAGEDLARADMLAGLRDAMEARLARLAGENGLEMTVFGAAASRLPNTSLFGVAGMTSDTQVIGLDLAGVAVSAGSACSSGKVHASHVLSAMGVSDDLATSAIRVSLGWSTDQLDVDRFVDAWYEIRIGKLVKNDATEMQKAS
ncbi:MAG: cysteine desulfurase, partial [Alphaproteobacteria bacterium]|nr:cysteine desulfurase [Alphaproteobacteria bacterium]